MAMREIRTVGDPVLRTPCDPITTIDARVRGLVEDLVETVDTDGRAGLAANQIGVGLRAFSWNIDDEVGYVLNPLIVELSEDEYQDGDEGCLQHEVDHLDGMLYLDRLERSVRKKAMRTIRDQL
jgi:peptide deformylase